MLYPTYLRLVLIKREAGITGCIIGISTAVFVVPPVVKVRVSCSRAVDADNTRGGLIQGNTACRRVEVKMGGAAIFLCFYQECGIPWEEGNVVSGSKTYQPTAGLSTCPTHKKTAGCHYIAVSQRRLCSKVTSMLEVNRQSQAASQVNSKHLCIFSSTQRASVSYRYILVSLKPACDMLALAHPTMPCIHLEASMELYMYVHMAGAVSTGS